MAEGPWTPPLTQQRWETAATLDAASPQWSSSPNDDMLTEMLDMGYLDDVMRRVQKD
jgi:hypothetical protein